MIIPSLDIFEGSVVRLHKGNYKKKRYYKTNPKFLLKKYRDFHARVIHIVDLSGAEYPECRQSKLMNSLARRNKNILQFGGGIRKTKHIEELLSSGALRIVIGSMAIQNSKKVSYWFKHFGSRSLVIAFDVLYIDQNTQYIVTQGWKKNSKILLSDAISYYFPLGLKNLLCTDVSCDGTLSGSNVRLYQHLCKKWPNIRFQASGGVNDLRNIKKLKQTGVHDVIVGRALLEKKFNFQEATECWQKE